MGGRGNLCLCPSTSTSTSYSYAVTVAVLKNVTCRVRWAQYLARWLSSLSSSSSHLLSPPSTSPDHEAAIIGGRVKSSTSTLTITTKEPAPPAAPTPLLPPYTALSPGAHLAQMIEISAKVPGSLGYLSSSSDYNYCYRHPSCSRSWHLSRVDGCVCCNVTRPPPAPGACLASTVAFAAMVPGRLGSPQ